MKRFSIGLLAVALVAVAGCDSEDTKTYDVAIFWQIAGADVCTANPGVGGVDELTFDKVRIDVYADEESETTIQSVEASCDDHVYSIEGLKHGNYWVRVNAMAQIEGDDEPLPYYQAEQEISAPSKADYADGYKFALEVGKSTVEIRWDFEEVGASCATYSLEDVDISIADEVVPCYDDELGMMYVVEDVSWNTYTIAVEGLDADGEVVTSGEYNEGEAVELKPREYVGDEAIVVVMSEL